MSDASLAAWLLSAAMLAGVAGMGWLALSMPAHAQQALGRTPGSGAVRVLRGLGALGLATALGFCLAADHASMAVLVWVMSLAAASLIVAFVLAWRARVLRVLVPWLRTASPTGTRVH